MNQSDMILIINDTILNFKKEIKQPVIMFIEQQRFSKLLDLMELKKHLHLTPCFVAEMKGGNIIYYCEEIIQKLINDFSKDKQKIFLEAITLHELFHIWNKIPINDAEEAIASELIVHEEIKKIYPKENKILNEFQQKINKFPKNH